MAFIARGGIGTNHLDGNTRLCTATAGQSLKETFGCDGQPNSVHDIEYCDTILHVGINTAETQTCSGCTSSTGCAARTRRARS